jgi:hypothetical protein
MAGPTKENNMQSIIERMIRNRLDRTEAWAREAFDGPPEALEGFIATARDQTLNAIGQAVRPFMPAYINQHPVTVSNMN